MRREQVKLSSSASGAICARRNPKAGSPFRIRDSNQKYRICARRWDIRDMTGKIRVAVLAQRYFVRIEDRLGRLARFCHTRRRLVLLLWVLGLIAFTFVGQVVFGSAFANKFGSGNFESARAQQLLQQHFPAASGDSAQVVFDMTNPVTSPANQADINAVVSTLGGLPHVANVTSPLSPAGQGQISPDGRQAKGQFYIQKPGKVRFEYDPPSPIDIIADGTQVVVRDRKLDTRDFYPLSQTPLRFLLADRIDLLKETNVVSVSSDDTFVSLQIEEKQTLGGSHKVLLMFSVKDMTLKQWTITDPQGFDTTVALANLDASKKLDPAMFRIDYARKEIIQ